MDAVPARGPERKPTRILLYAALGFLVFWFTYLTFFGPKRTARLENSGTSQPAEYDWTVLDLDDQPVAFSKFKGKTIFLNFWATWCPPCIGEMPSIDALAKDPRLKGKSIEFLCVSIDQDAETVRSFLKGKDMGMTFLRAKDGKFPPVFHSEGIPTTFLIAADGRIAASEVGSADWHEPRVVEFLEKLASGGK
jgi:thiol-disulfide isomerase/thioredoxin